MQGKNQKNISAAYNSAAKTYAENLYRELDYKPLDRLLLDRFSEIIPPGGPVCDIGCGPGEVANYLYSKNLNVTGIDISEEMINEAKRLNPEIDFKTGDMLDLDIPDGLFAGICSFYAIVNFRYDDIKRIIKEYYRILSVNGILLMAFHVGDDKVHVENFFDTGKVLDFYYFDENRIMEYLKKAGFKINEALVRLPYKEEYPSRRAYIIAEKISSVYQKS